MFARWLNCSFRNLNRKFIIVYLAVLIMLVFEWNFLFVWIGLILNWFLPMDSVEKLDNRDFVTDGIRPLNHDESLFSVDSIF